MPTLTIFRGLPGSGKSTIANEKETIVLSPADMYSMRDGVYQWSLDNSERGRAWAYEIFEFCLLHEIDITIAEVLPKIEYVMNYVTPALERGYIINVVDIKVSIDESYKRNTHNVPKEHIKLMSDIWEDWDNKYLKL